MRLRRPRAGTEPVNSEELAPGSPTSADAPVDQQAPGEVDVHRNAWRIAALFVLPYLLFMIAWAFSNPPGAAPDEADQLVKAIGAGRLSIGSTYHGTLKPHARPVAVRNASISRVVSVPADLNPRGFKCTAFSDTNAPSCLPTTVPAGTGDVHVATDVGSYPPFLYLPIGLAALATHSPTAAFHAARVVCLVMATILLFLGAAHLVRWLGRRALLGAFVALTPMTLFCGASVGTSGVEICGAFGVAAVAVVAAFRRESVFRGLTMLTLTVCGAALILSRQLGSVTFTAAILLTVARIGLPALWALIRRHSWPFLSAVAVLAVCLGLILWWEPNYDNPAITGPALSKGALYGFDNHAFPLIREGVAQFGWLETMVPRWIVFAWIILAVAMVGLAVLFGRVADRWSLVAWMAALVVLAYVTYATVFYPIRAGIQGRHLLPFFMLVPLLSGVVVSHTVGRVAPAVVRRLFLFAAFVMPLIQFGSLYFNARRYAVGPQHSWLFLGHSTWSPVLGWGPWLGLGLVAAALLAVVMVLNAPSRRAVRTTVDPVIAPERTPDLVER